VLEEKGLAPSSINVRLAALRKLAMEGADNGLLDPAVASAIGRVKGSMQKGRRIGRWLTREEASLLLRDSGEDGLKAKRDGRCFAFSSAPDCGGKRSFRSRWNIFSSGTDAG
jgi:hypothetical protein